MRTKDFPYCSQSSRMLCSVRYGPQGGRLGFLWIKDKSLVGSPNLYATVRGAQVRVGNYRFNVEESPNHSSTIPRFKDAGTRL